MYINHSKSNFELTDKEKERRKFLKTLFLGVSSGASLLYLNAPANAFWPSVFSENKENKEKIIRKKIGEKLELIIPMYNTKGIENKKELITIETELDETNSLLNWSIKTGDPDRKKTGRKMYHKEYFKKQNTPIRSFPTFAVLPPGALPSTLKREILKVRPIDPLYYYNIEVVEEIEKIPPLDLFWPIRNWLISKKLAKKNKDFPEEIKISKRDLKEISEYSFKEAIKNVKKLKDYKEIEKIAREIDQECGFWEKIAFPKEMPNEFPIQIGFSLSFKTNNLKKTKNNIFLVMQNPRIGIRGNDYDSFGKLEKTIIFQGEFEKTFLKKTGSLSERIKALEFKESDLCGFEFANEGEWKGKYKITKDKEMYEEMAKINKIPDGKIIKNDGSAFYFLIHLLGYEKNPKREKPLIIGFSPRLIGGQIKFDTPENYYNNLRFYIIGFTKPYKARVFFEDLKKTIDNYKKRTHNRFPREIRNLNSSSIQNYIQESFTSEGKSNINDFIPLFTKLFG